MSGSFKEPFGNRVNLFENCPKLFKNVTIDSEGSISKIQCLDSSITSEGSIYQLSAFLGYMGFPTNRCEFFLQSKVSFIWPFDLGYHGNSIPECTFEGYSVKNFDGASLITHDHFPDSFENRIGIQDSYMIWLHYTVLETWEWREAKNFVTFCFEENNEDVEVKEFGVRLICDEDIQQGRDLSMLQGLQTPTQHGGFLNLYNGPFGVNAIIGGAKVLSMFGTLVSPKLRASQLTFKTALETLVEIANARSRILKSYEALHRDMKSTKE
nr:hypothetical protein [Tanacetum cinerariifolium]